MSNFLKLVNGRPDGTAMVLTDLPSIATATALANISGSSSTPTAVSLVSTATASTIMFRDVNANTQVNNLIENVTTTATAAGTTTLTVSSTYTQQFTGTTTQTVVLPDATTLKIGQSFLITNRSTGIITVNANGGSLIQTMVAGSQTVVTAITIGTSAGTWDSAYSTTTGGFTSPLTTKGDTLTFSTTNVRQAVPTDYGRLIPDSNQTDGWRAASYTQIQQGRPGKNYIQYADFENNATTGWSLGTIGTLTNGLPTGSPTFGSGASGNLSISIVNSGQLAGTASLSYASTAATTQGDMLATQAYTIDIEDQAKVLGYRFYFKAQSGTTNCNFSGTSSNSFALAAYDVTNSVFLPVVGAFSMVQGTGVGIASGTLQTGATTASIRWIVYNANATAGAATLYFDDFFSGPQVSPIAPAMSDWTNSLSSSFTFSSGLGSTSNPSIWTKRIGDSLYVNGYVTIGTSTSSIAYIQLPSQYVIDTSKMSTGTNNQRVGGWNRERNSTIANLASNDQIGPMFYDGSTNNQLFLSYQEQNTQLVKQSANNLFTTIGDIWAFDFIVPIAGWSSNSVASSDTDTRVVAARYTGVTASITSSYSNVTFTTQSVDTSASYSGATYTVPVSGIYDFGGQVYVSGTASLNGTTVVGIAQNGSIVGESDFTYAGAITGSVGIPFNFGSVSCKAGDTIVIQVKSSITLPVITASSTANFFQVERISGPAVITATETVAISYSVTTPQSTGGARTVINFNSKDFDTHNAVTTGSGWIFTTPVSGIYSIASQVAWQFAASQIADIYIFINGSQYCTSEVFSTAGDDGCAIINQLVRLNAGDTVQIQAIYNGGTLAIVSALRFCTVNIHRIGN